MIPSSVRPLARRLRLGLARRLDPASALPRPDPTVIADARAHEIAQGLIERAGEASAGKAHHHAALLYEEALRLDPSHFGAQVQCGHMFKEAGDLPKAEAHYMAAVALQPDDADLALQLGHFYKVAGRLGRSEAEYRRALELKPGWSDPTLELARLGSRTRRPEPLADGVETDLDGLVPELFPRPASSLKRTYVDAVHMRRLGARRERSRWGVAPTLRGVEAVRGFCIASTPLRELRLTFNDRLLHAGPLEGAPMEGGLEGQRKYVFNLWLDVSALEPGAYEAELRFIDVKGGEQSHREYVVVAPALSEAEFPDSDGVVNVAADRRDDLEAAINARPSVVRPARREALPPPKTVLVMRTDQLGDMATSAPAVKRLREILPDARLVGLLTAGNAEFGATLGVFDEIITVDFPDDPLERRRIMGPEKQEALRRRLAAYDFDIAIDLAESAVSRPLLLLSGARFLYGYFEREWLWLDGGFEATTRDRKNALETAPQSTKVRALIDRLGNTLQTRAEIIRRPDLTRARVEAYGIGADQRYAVFHTGARIAFSRWPYYRELAELILARTDLKVIVIADDPAYRATLPETLAGSPRFALLDRRLPFDDFDALLSFASVFVGNDSGPKHLAALRGTPVVSIHSSRINWNEWGQELTGSIISRKVPCAGCTIFHDEDECGKGFVCVTRILPEEVFAAVQAEL